LISGGFLALQHIATAVLNEGDNILVPSIGYPYYQGLNKVNIFKIYYFNLLLLKRKL
jgi:aspartate/methionine/tyrosine aminotransferase